MITIPETRTLTSVSDVAEEIASLTLERDAERKRNEELRGLLREQVNIGQMCHVCGAHPCYSNCRLRAALEGR